MAASERELLDLCNSGYGELHKGDSVSGGWTVADQINTHEVDNAKDGGFAAVILRKGDETVVVFRGTDFKTYGDTSTDVDLAVSADNPQYQALRTFLVVNADELKGNVTFAGHSLGGNLAMHATLTSGVPARCVTFNAPGFSDEYVQAHPQFGQMGDHITEYQNERDIVSSIGRHPSGPIIVESAASVLALNHDLGDLALSGDDLVRKDPQIKAGRCYIVQELSALVDKVVPGGGALHTFVKGVLQVVYSNPTAAGYAGLAALLAIAIFAPAAIAYVVVAALAIVVVVAAFEFGMWLGTEIVKFMDWVAEEAKKLAKSILETAVAVGGMIVDGGAKLLSAINSSINDFCTGLGKALSGFWEMLTGGGAVIRQAMAVNTDRLRLAASRLQMVNRRIVNVDCQLDRLRLLLQPAEWQQWFAVAGVDLQVGYSFEVASCAGYLAQAADRLDGCETQLAGRAHQFR